MLWVGKARNRRTTQLLTCKNEKQNCLNVANFGLNAQSVIKHAFLKRNHVGTDSGLAVEPTSSCV